jgi:hypothetical protein
MEGPATNAKEVGMGNPAEENVLLLDNYLSRKFMAIKSLRKIGG